MNYNITEFESKSKYLIIICGYLNSNRALVRELEAIGSFNVIAGSVSLRIFCETIELYGVSLTFYKLI